MYRTRKQKLQKRAVTFTAAALFCSIILFAGIFTAFVRIHNTISDDYLHLPILQKTDEGQVQFSILSHTETIDIQKLNSIDDSYAAYFMLLPDDSGIIFSFFDIFYNYLSN